MKTRIELAGTWTAQLSDGRTQEVQLPGTLDENRLGDPDAAGLEGRLTRRYTWTGQAVFTKEIQLPRAADQRLVLEVERARQLQVEADGKPVPVLQPPTLSTAGLFELTEWAGQTIRLGLKSDNRYENWPSADILNASAATDETQTNWNGILGRICIHICPKLWIKAVRVYPSQGKISVAVDVAASQNQLMEWTGPAALLSLTGSALVEPSLWPREKWDISARSESMTTLWCRDIPLSAQAPLWEEGKGNMASLRAAILCGDETLADCETTFGIRTFRAKEGRLVLNGHKFFLRGEANCCVFPETGHPPMDHDSWVKVLQAYRDYGVNCMRFHSWCPPEAAFSAADQLGMLVQPELSDWNFKNALESPNSLEYYALELEQILLCYANHPSFVMLTLGNELATGELGHARMTQLLELARKIDPTRLYANSSNGHYGEQGKDPASDFYTAAAYGKKMLRATSSPMIGHLNQNRPGTRYSYDEAAALTGDMPVFGFEVGQYENWPDFAQLNQFQGVTTPGNLAAIQNRAAETGALAYWEQGVQATGELALLCYREEVEAVLRTPKMSGLSLLGLQDFPGQGTALVGLMDCHLNPKPYDFALPARFRSFFAPVVLLACFDSYTYEAGERLEADIKIANYGAKTLQSPLHWRLREGEGILCQGEIPPEKGWAPGELWQAGSIACPLPADSRPHAMTLELQLEELTARYPLWSYPHRRQTAPEKVLFLRKVTQEALEQIQAGASALIDLPADKENYPSSAGCQFSTDFWSVGTFPEQEGTMGLLIQADHPALQNYPTRFCTDWQWWTQSHGRAMLLPEQAKPIVRVLDSVTRLRNLGLLWELRLGKGRILLSGMDLLGHTELPECRYLAECLAEYLAGPAPEDLFEIEAPQLSQWVRLE